VAPPASSIAATNGSEGTITSSVIPPGQSLRGDGDTDNPTDHDGNGDNDGGIDVDNDYPTAESYKLPDKDDKATFAYGHPANTAVRRATGRVLERYYAAAAAGDGVSACSLLPSDLARSVPEAYGQGAGPAYLRGGKTCQAVMSMLFKHFHGQLVEAPTVVGVLIQGDRAQVVLSSRRMRASHVFLQRQGSSWKVDELLGQALP
jgi:hypothetical protein